MADDLRYVPILLAKRGERGALLELPVSARPGLVPLLVAPPAPRESTTNRASKTAGRHLGDLVQGIGGSWTGRAFLDLRHFQDRHPYSVIHPLESFVDDVGLFGVIDPVPVTSPKRTAPYNAAVATLHRSHGCGVCLRLSPDEWPSADGGVALDGFLKSLGIEHGEADLVLDLGIEIRGAPNVALRAVQAELTYLSSARDWRNVVVAGTAFPPNMTGIAAGLTSIRRAEWKNYLELAGSAPGRRPAFGDYAVNSPEGEEAALPRGFSVSASLRYASGDQWIIAKGGLYSGKQAQGAAAMNPVAELLQASPHFAGPQHCPADTWIAAVAAGAKGGNPEAWRRYGTVHHLTTVSEQLANLFGP